MAHGRELPTHDHVMAMGQPRDSLRQILNLGTRVANVHTNGLGNFIDVTLRFGYKMQRCGFEKDFLAKPELVTLQGDQLLQISVDDRAWRSNHQSYFVSLSFPWQKLVAER